MITKYKDYIYENSNVYSREIHGPFFEMNLEKYHIKKYIINDDGSLTVNQDVDLRKRKLEKLLLKFKTINGSLLCDECDLTTLENCPEYVQSNFRCPFNKITSLKFSPRTIQGSFLCNSNNSLTSLEFGPQYVGNNYFYDNIKDISDYPLCIVEGAVRTFDRIDPILNIITSIVKNNSESFTPYIKTNNKKEFHKQILKFDPELIKYYTSWNPFDNKNTKLLI